MEKAPIFNSQSSCYTGIHRGLDGLRPGKTWYLGNQVTGKSWMLTGNIGSFSSLVYLALKGNLKLRKIGSWEI